MPNVNDVYKAHGAKNKNEYITKLRAEKLALKAIATLTDSSGGTPSATIVDVPASYTEATLANQLASLTARVNALSSAGRT